MKTLLLLPNQLFNLDILKSIEFNNIILYEHPKFFTEYVYHKSKLVFHRSTMKNYYDFIKKHYTIKYLEYNDKFVIKNDIILFDPTDFDIHSKIEKYTKKYKLNLEIVDSPLFIFTLNDLENYMNSNKSRNYFNATFYKWARIEKNILMNGKNPIGGKWSFDTENRLPFKKDYKEKEVKFIQNKYIEDATKYIERNFPDNYGEINIFVPINLTLFLKSDNSFSLISICSILIEPVPLALNSKLAFDAVVLITLLSILISSIYRSDRCAKFQEFVDVPKL